MTKAKEQTCEQCRGRGYLLLSDNARKPRPAYWFNRGPNGERPEECGCGVLEGDSE